MNDSVVINILLQKMHVLCGTVPEFKYVLHNLQFDFYSRLLYQEKSCVQANK